ncbi:MAG TPA: response regulator [Clostridiaceae bacterium]|nr:response regulator [Clostridiaceae bacterium]
MFKVFLVEDENVVREGIRKNIPWEQYGFHYTGDASDGELALPLIRKIRPDLLITDIKMPFMDGLSLIDLVRKELPKTKIVIISGYDDFLYAQQAIRMGVDQYLLKPIIKEKLVEILIGLHEKMQEERRQQEYIESFKREAQEYENFSRRRFFEQIVTGGLSVSEISETAKTLNIDINAPYYNIILFSFSSTKYNASSPESYTENLAEVQDNVTNYIIDHSEFILFRWNITTYAVLVKGSQDEIQRNTSNCIQNIKDRCATAGQDVGWYIACGTPVSRLGAIPACFAEANRILSYRHLCPEEHILSETSIQKLRKDNRIQIGSGNKEIDLEYVRKFLSNGTENEVDNFIDQMLQNTGDEFKSLPMFCKYVTMTVYFAAIEYLDSIGCRMDSLWSQELRPDDRASTIDEARQYVHQVIKQTIELRDRESAKQQHDILRQAIAFIDKSYSESSISLDKVAKKVNISPNYLSAIFSQEVGQTLTEYLTYKRIDEAKRMLRQTDNRLSEIAFAVGYKDPRYFSFVFKKVTGRTPSDYRRGINSER